MNSTTAGSLTDMRLTKIRNETDHAAALAEIDRLLRTSPEVGSPDSESLEVLSMLVEEYEGKAFPLELPTPVDAIKFRMEQMGLEQRDLIPFIGSRSRVSEVLNHKRPLTLTMMRALHRGLGIPAAVFLRDEPSEVQAGAEPDWSKYPLREMAKLGWLDAPKRIMKSHAKELMERFAEPLLGHGSAYGSLLKRTRTLRSARAINLYALDAWCTRVRIRAAESPLETEFDRTRIDSACFRRIAQLSVFEDGPLRAVAALGDLGVHLVVERHLTGTHLDGAALLSADGKPIVALTIRHDRVDSFWFCLLHELAHIALHLDPEVGAPYIDDMESPTKESAVEKEADLVAREALVPSPAFRASRAYSVRSVPAVLDLARSLGVHPSVVAGRIRFEANDYRILGSLVPSGEVRRHFPEVFGR